MADARDDGTRLSASLLRGCTRGASRCRGAIVGVWRGGGHKGVEVAGGRTGRLVALEKGTWACGRAWCRLCLGGHCPQRWKCGRVSKDGTSHLNASGPVRRVGRCPWVFAGLVSLGFQGHRPSKVQVICPCTFCPVRTWVGWNKTTGP